MRVDELAERALASGHAVRYYDRLGLLRNRFDSAALGRLRFIRIAKTLGFTLAEIRNILEMNKVKESPCQVVREISRRRIEQNAASIRELVGLQRRLKGAAKRWAGKPDRVPEGHAVCHLIEGFGEDA